jgi:hypothetical protein
MIFSLMLKSCPASNTEYKAKTTAKLSSLCLWMVCVCVCVCVYICVCVQGSE